MAPPRKLSDAEVEIIGRTYVKFGRQITAAAHQTIMQRLGRPVSKPTCLEWARWWVDHQIQYQPDEATERGETGQFEATEKPFRETIADQPLSPVERRHKLAVLASRMILDWERGGSVDAKTLLQAIEKLGDSEAVTSAGMSPELSALWDRFTRACEGTDPVMQFRLWVEHCEQEAERYRREGWEHYEAGAFVNIAPDWQQAIDRLEKACGEKYNARQLLGDLALTVEANS